MPIKSAAIQYGGIIYTGFNHYDAAARGPMFDYNGRRVSLLTLGVQGFITDTGEFVTRKEAATIALACGQVKRLRYYHDELDSADLNYPEREEDSDA